MTRNSAREDRAPRSSFWVLTVLAVAALLVSGSTLCAAPVTQDLLAATVYVKVERAFKGEKLKGFGTGFFIHEDGYILTTWQVVADQVEYSVKGQTEQPARVTKLSVVVDSGSERERELEAKVISRNRRLDLALLRVHYRPATFLSPEHVTDPELGSRILVAGFPFGDLLAFDRRLESIEGANPQATLSTGMITALRRDQAGDVVRLQTDAALNPGSSGSPLVDEAGQLVGVVTGGVDNGKRIFFGVPPEQLRQFVGIEAVRVQFEPKMVLDPPVPIVVTVTPLLVDVRPSDGVVRVEGGDIQAATFPLTGCSAGLGTTIVFPDRIPGAERPAGYTAIVSLRSQETGELITQRYSIDAVPQSLGTASGRPIADSVREVVGTDPSHEPLTEAKRRGQRSLSEAAAEVTLSTDASGGLVLDNAVVKEIGAVKLDPKYFENLPPDLRDVAEEYEVASREYSSFMDRQPRYLRGQAAVAAWDERTRLSEKVETLKKKLIKREVWKCTDEPVYFLNQKGGPAPPCSGTFSRLY